MSRRSSAGTVRKSDRSPLFFNRSDRSASVSPESRISRSAPVPETLYRVERSNTPSATSNRIRSAKYGVYFPGRTFPSDTSPSEDGGVTVNSPSTFTVSFESVPIETRKADFSRSALLKWSISRSMGDRVDRNGAVPDASSNSTTPPATRIVSASIETPGSFRSSPAASRLLSSPAFSPSPPGRRETTLIFPSPSRAR